MSLNLQTGALALGCVLTLALGQAIPALFTDGMPQAPGEDVVALVLGDMRQELSNTLLDKAEEYYHGGVRDVACEHGLASQEDADEPGHEPGHDHHDHEATVHPPSGGGDPWVWIDGQVHVQEDRHLERGRAVELLPWFWGACRTSPQNVQAFLLGSYALSSMAGKPEEGVRLLEEGIQKNPACAELDFSLGELLFNSLHDAKRAEPFFLSAREKCHPVEGPAGENARILKLRTIFYLGYLAKQRGDPDRVRVCLAEAEALDPKSVCTRDLRALLKK